MSICTNCGTNIADDVKFCTSCGAAQLSNTADGVDLQQTHQPGDIQHQTPITIEKPIHDDASARRHSAPESAPQEPNHTAITPLQAPRATSQAGDSAVVGTFGWLGTLILFAIPVVGFVLCIMWAFGNVNLNRRNFSRACLILSVIAIALSIVFAFVLVPMGMAWVKGTVEPYMKQIEQVKEQIKKTTDGLPKYPTK